MFRFPFGIDPFAFIALFQMDSPWLSTNLNIELASKNTQL